MYKSVLTSFLAIFCLLIPISPQAIISSDKYVPEIWQKEMLRRVNEIRAEGCRCGRKKMPPIHPLKWNEKLAKVAHKHATDMDRNNFIGHRGSNGSRIGQRVDRGGYNWKRVAENVAWNVRTVSGAVLGWRDSPGHCQSMMGNYHEMGAAHVGEFWVQVFASPMD